MRIELCPSEIPVLMLFNLDPEWSAEDRYEVFSVTLQAKNALSEAGYPVTLVPIANGDIDNVLANYDPLEYIVFNWCDGLPGLPHSEWFVPEYLEQHGFIFTGASSSALALTQDKYRVKKLLDEAGLPTPLWEIYDNGYPVTWKSFPAIVKASREHSSEGINRGAVVSNQVNLKKRIHYVLKRFQHPALVEDFIDGREFHVSLWGNGIIEMLPPVEMEFPSSVDENARLCTYESKFVPESEQFNNIKTVVPAPLSGGELDEIEQICKTAYYLTDCRDYARIDIRMKDGLFYILDINPNSDICPDTSTISAAEYAGYSYSDFLSSLVSLSAQRHPKWGNKVAIPSRNVRLSKFD